MVTDNPLDRETTHNITNWSYHNPECTNPMYAEPDEGDDITEELTVSELLTGMLSRLRASNTMSVDELLNPPEENVLMEDPTDEDYCPVDSNSENEIRSELSSV
ncbi:hypothetical protein GQ600_9900 [Phytophthora cactorum]|nr:hypothetical protein GQ600_9900 [Phytophthora cactorum]